MRKPVKLLAAVGLFLSAAVAHAEWIGLADTSRPAVNEVAEAGFEAFNAFGCAECHKNLAEQAYQSGFRVVGEAEEVYADKGGQAYSPVASASRIVLSGRAYEQVADNPALYVLRAHQHIPEAFNSMQDFQKAGAKQQSAIVDYVLMF